MSYDMQEARTAASFLFQGSIHMEVCSYMHVPLHLVAQKIVVRWRLRDTKP